MFIITVELPIYFFNDALVTLRFALIPNPEVTEAPMTAYISLHESSFLEIKRTLHWYQQRNVFRMSNSNMYNLDNL